MGRRQMIDRGVQVKVYVPGTVVDKLRSELYSEIEGKVPYGALSGLVNELLTEWLRKRGTVV